MVKSYSDQLQEVQAAIAAIESGSQSYSIGNRATNRADLKTLYDREKWLRKMVDREDRGGIRVQYGVHA